MSEFTYAEWEELRRAARLVVEQRARWRFTSLRVGPVDRNAISEAGAWPKSVRRVDWDWHGITKNRQTARIDAAFWADGELCGLTFGLVTARGAMLTRLEASPRVSHPLKGYVTDLAVAVLETVAIAVDADRLLLQDPDPNLIDWYSRFGFARVADPRFARYVVKERRRT